MYFLIHFFIDFVINLLMSYFCIYFLGMYLIPSLYGFIYIFPSFNRVSPKKGGGPNCDNRVPGTCKEKTRTNPEVQTTPSHLGTHSPYDSVVATYPHRGATYTRAAT